MVQRNVPKTGTLKYLMSQRKTGQFPLLRWAESGMSRAHKAFHVGEQRVRCRESVEDLQHIVLDCDHWFWRAVIPVKPGPCAWAFASKPVVKHEPAWVRRASRAVARTTADDSVWLGLDIVGVVAALRCSGATATLNGISSDEPWLPCGLELGLVIFLDESSPNPG
eukprot:1633872-Amphidinium_carterae.1